MAKPKEQEKEKNIRVGIIWNCADIKLILGTLLICCLIATFNLLPYKSFMSPSDFRSCLSKLTQSPPDPTPLAKESLLPSSVIKRTFNPVGSAAYLFIQMGAYRGGLNTFAVIGLASKPLHVFAKPQFKCEWIPNDNISNIVTGSSYKILPDWGYGRVYTVVVVNCTFPSHINSDGRGGKLVMTATDGGALEEKFIAMEEKPNSVNFTLFESAPRYDYLYCGSPLYGNLSPQRVREWMAYHVKLFGDKAHFVIHDAGGVHEEVMEVLRPWIERGVLTVQDVRDQERFDGYYHNQFLVVNDCLHRYRFDAKWMFFFDLDEFIYMEKGRSIGSVVNEFKWFTQFTIEQMPMASKLCLSEDAGKISSMWGIEKLVYRDVKRGIRRDRKYAIQPRNAFAAGVHLSQNFAGKTLHKTEGKIKYFHYHGTIATRKEPCMEFVNATDVYFDHTPYYRDETLRNIADSTKKFELDTIGSRLMPTRQ